MAFQADMKLLPGILAGANLSTKQFHCVKPASTDGEVVVADAITDLVTGLLQNDPEDTYEAEVAYGGIAKGKSATSVGWSDGIAIGFNTTSQLVPLTANTTNDNRNIIGYLPGVPGNGTIAIGEIISVMVLPGVLRL